MSVSVYDKTEDKLIPVAGGTVYADSPIGSIIPYGGSQPPAGWLICDGRYLSKNDYFDLFKVIGYNFGGSDSTFNVPDLREATTKGVGLSGKSDNHYDADGVALGEFINDRFQGHEHDAYKNRTNAVFATAGGTGMDNLILSATKAVVTDGINGTPRIGATTEVKAVGVNYIIKVKQVAVPIDLTNAVKDLIKETTYECRGILINGYSRTITGNGHAVVTLKNGIVKIEFSAKIETNDSTPDDYTGWGLSWNLLRYNIPELPADIIPKMENSKLQYFSETGTLLTDLMGYSAIGVPSPPWWQPHKMYESGGSVSSLRPSQFPVGSYIMGTVYGTYTI
jgi:microcystin-dependent protein